MAMPEAAIREQNNLHLRQNRIGRSWEILPVVVWLEPKFFEQRCKMDLRGSMFPLDLGHDLRTLGFAIDISHRTHPCDQNV